MNTQTPVIELTHLVRKYGRTDAVHDLSLRVERGRCYGFILVAEGLSANPEMLTVHLGLLGALIGSMMKKRVKKKREATIHRIDQLDPEQLLAEHKHNFKLHTAEIREGAIEPRPFLALHGHQAGRLILFLRDGRKTNLEFETNDDMTAALVVLPKFMDSSLRVNVEWDERKKRFRKKRLLAVSGGMTRECCGGDSTNGTGPERRGTGSGTGRTLKIINLYRPRYTGTGNYPGEHPLRPCPSALDTVVPVFHRKQRKTWR